MKTDLTTLLKLRIILLQKLIEAIETTNFNDNIDVEDLDFETTVLSNSVTGELTIEVIVYQKKDSNVTTRRFEAVTTERIFEAEAYNLIANVIHYINK